MENRCHEGTEIGNLCCHRADKYDEVGTELMFDTEEFPDTFKKGGNLVGAAGRAHNLEVLLHMIDPKRDAALCNKSEDALVVSSCHPKALTNMQISSNMHTHWPSIVHAGVARHCWRFEVVSTHIAKIDAHLQS